MEKKHKSGFVNIVGNPNVGKSTLMNSLVGERISIITSKAQTTRHRIMGIVNTVARRNNVPIEEVKTVLIEMLVLSEN